MLGLSTVLYGGCFLEDSSMYSNGARGSQLERSSPSGEHHWGSFVSWAKASMPTQADPVLSATAVIFPPPGVCSQAHHRSPCLAPGKELSLCDPT